MGDDITLSPEQMRTTASTFTSSSGIIETELKTLDTAVNQLVSCWTGTSGEAFLTDFKNYKSACEKMIECLEERADALQKSANATEQYDADLAKAWQ